MSHNDQSAARHTVGYLNREFEGDGNPSLIPPGMFQDQNPQRSLESIVAHDEAHDGDPSVLVRPQNTSHYDETLHEMCLPMKCDLSPPCVAIFPCVAMSPCMRVSPSPCIYDSMHVFMRFDYRLHVSVPS